MLAAMSSTHDPSPTEITLHSASRVLEIAFDDGRSFRLPFEFLRVYSPSAEVRGHGPGQETYLYGLGVEQDALWAEYLEQLEAAGASRDPDESAGSAVPKPGGSACGHH